MSLNEIVENNLAKSETDPDIGAFDSEIAELRATIESLEEKDKAVTSKGEGFMVIGEPNKIDIEIKKKEDELRAIEKDKTIFINKKEIKSLIDKNNVFEKKKKSEIEQLIGKIKKLEKEYKDRITGVAGFLDKDEKEDPIEAEIKQLEEKIKTIENSFNGKIKKNEELILKIQDKIKAIEGIDSRDVLVENSKQEDLKETEVVDVSEDHKFDNAKLFKATDADENEGLTHEGTYTIDPEKLFKNRVDTNAEIKVESDSEEFIPKHIEKNEETVQVFEEKEQSSIEKERALKDQEREVLKQEIITAKAELDVARMEYFERYAKKKEEFLVVYRRLFTSGLEKAEAALQEDILRGDLATFKTAYENSLAKYCAAHMKEALFGFEGEEYEFKKITNERYLEIMERNEVSDVQTLQRARDLEPVKSDAGPIRNSAEVSGAKSWFEDKWEKSRDFMKKNSCVLKNAVAGALILGIGIFTASKLSDNQKNKTESVKSPVAVTLKAESSQKNNKESVHALSEKDKIYEELSGAIKELTNIENKWKELREKNIQTPQQPQQPQQQENFSTEIGSVGEEILTEMQQLEKEQERLQNLIPILQKKYDTMNVYTIGSNGPDYIGGDTDDGKLMSKDLKIKKSSLEQGHLRLHKLAIDLEISKNGSIRENVIKLKNGIFGNNEQLFREYSNVKIADILSSNEAMHEFLNKLPDDSSRMNFNKIAKITHNGNDSMRKFLVRSAFESSKVAEGV